MYKCIVCESPGKSGNAEGSSPAVVGSMPLHVNRRFLKPAFEECLTSVSSSSRRVASSRSKRIRSFTKKGWGEEEEEEEEDRREDTQTHRPHSHAMSDETRGWRISSREEEGGLKGTEDENRVEDGMNG